MSSEAHLNRWNRSSQPLQSIGIAHALCFSSIWYRNCLTINETGGQHIESDVHPHENEICHDVCSEGVRDMKGWVKPYILQRTSESVGQLVEDEPDRDQWLALKSKALEDREILYHELTSYLNCHFGRELGDPQEFFLKVFGSVLADLPGEVFKKLCGVKNLFFTYTPHPGAELKAFELNHRIDEGNLHIVAFPHSSGYLPQRVLRGEIVHELAHVYRGTVEVVEEEDQIDAIAVEWGFEREIKAFREHTRETRSKQRQHSRVIERKPVPSETQEPAFLMVNEENASDTRAYEVKDGVTSIGRDPDNDIVLKDPYVSGHHARICFEDGEHVLSDCVSRNGTRLNGQRIDRKKIVDLDIIEIGQSAFTFISSFISKEVS